VKQVAIENPVINSPFREPGRHFKFTDEETTNEIIEGRWTSSHFVPIAQPRKKKGSKQLVFDTEWTQDRIEENKLVNQIRARLTFWREGVRYVKNRNLGFTIPYTFNGEAKNNVPDFVACFDDAHGPDDLLNLLIEVTGEHKKDKAVKVAVARTLWVPTVNNRVGFGRWAFWEIDDPWNARATVRSLLESQP